MESRLLTKEPFSIRVLLRDQLQGSTGLPTPLLFTTRKVITWLCLFSFDPSSGHLQVRLLRELSSESKKAHFS